MAGITVLEASSLLCTVLFPPVLFNLVQNACR